MMRSDIEGEFPCSINSTFEASLTIPGEKQANTTGNTNGNLTYDPDVAHSAAIGHDDDINVNGDINERKLMTKIDLRIIPVLSVLYLMVWVSRARGRSDTPCAGLPGPNEHCKCGSLQSTRGPWSERPAVQYSIGHIW
jgi:hypothetical protein